MNTFDLLIVGTGPAGSAAALHLLQRDPAWAGRILMLDKARHPRPKLCGGGLTEWGERELHRLGLSIEVPRVDVRRARFAYEDLSVSVWGEPIIRITRRDEFDEWLSNLVKARGVTVCEGEEVLDVTVEPEAARVRTRSGEYRAKALVAADGSKSTVRQRLGFAHNDSRRVARLLEVLTPEDPGRTPEYLEGSAVFDFSPVAGGVQGYYWDFPSLVNGQPFMNRGLYDSRMIASAPRAALKPALAESLRRRDRSLEAVELKGNPIHWFTPTAEFSRPRVLLAGDAAGVDPLFGEGIGYALAYGRVAAQAVADAFASGDFSFRSYRRQILLDWLGRDLTLRWLGARISYRLIRTPRRARLALRLLQLAVPLIPWCNRRRPTLSQRERLARQRPR